MISACRSGAIGSSFSWSIDSSVIAWGMGADGAGLENDRFGVLVGFNVIDLLFFLAMIFEFS